MNPTIMKLGGEGWNLKSISKENGESDTARAQYKSEVYNKRNRQ